MATYKIKRKTATNGSTEEILLPISSIDGLQKALDGKQASGSYATTNQVNAKYTKPSAGIPKSDLASAVQTSLGKADTAVQTESDPTVPTWAKASSKPTYTASEVGAVPTTRKVNGKALSADITLSASDVGALSLDGGTINTSKTIKMNASTNANGANLKWGTVNSKNPYIGYASDQTDGTFVIGSLLGTNYASGLAIGGGSGNLLWKGTKVATTSDIPSVPTVNNATLTIQKNGTNVATFTANASSNATANITVPTKVSELTNDSGFKTTDNNTTYSLSKSGSTITLTGSDGSTTSVTDANTTYSVPVNATTSTVLPSACTSNGFYYVTSSTNSLTDKDGNPFLQYHTSNADFRILATAYSTSWIQQIATDFRSEHVYIRRCENGTWKPWTKIAQTSEIPSVSNSTITIKQTGIADQTFTLNGGAKTITLADKNTSYSNATTSAAGLMSAADKTIINRFTYDDNTPQLVINGGASSIDMNDDAVHIDAAGGLYYGGNEVAVKSDIPTTVDEVYVINGALQSAYNDEYQVLASATPDITNGSGATDTAVSSSNVRMNPYNGTLTASILNMLSSIQYNGTTVYPPRVIGSSGTSTSSKGYMSLSSSLSTSTNKLKVQWGWISVNADSTGTITFSSAFSGATSYAVILTQGPGTSSSSTTTAQTDNYINGVYVTAKKASSFTYKTMTLKNWLQWIAIGV